jgi:AIPR protein
MSLADDYKLVTDLARIEEAGGLAKERSVLLLWFFRNVLGLDDLDAYEYVCDGDKDQGIDGLYLEPSTGDDDYETLVIYQSKYTTAPKDQKRSVLNELLGAAPYFKNPESLQELVDGDVEDKLKALIKKFGLIRKLKDAWFSDGKLRIRLVLVTTGTLSADARRVMDATNAAEGAGYLDVYDLRRLGPLAKVVAVPDIEAKPITARCPKKFIVVVGDPPNRIAVAAIKAADVVKWKDLASGALFALNVRRELPRNRVRDQLDGAVRRTNEHPDFLRFHNGMTVVCEEFDLRDGKLTATKPSIVNGAQSAAAFAQAQTEGVLTDDLRIFIKFVEVAGRPQLAKEVSWRSNTQTAVNARNLMALGGPQARIKREVEADYPVIYEITPDAKRNVPKGKRVIANDEIAQVLCALFNAMPWLAVKRLVLFESENHAQIFNERTTGSHVVLADIVRQCVNDNQDQFPKAYQQSWKLTRLIAVYLVGQVLHVDEDLSPILADPKTELADESDLRQKLDFPVRVAATVLEQRRDHLESNGLPDNFSVDFKNQEELHDLRNDARRTAIAYKKLGTRK